jgi:hypothetical protein
VARNLFGGSAADVAEDVDGRRIPGAVGTVWDGPSIAATQVTDLTDINGEPIAALMVDSSGFLASFYGPDGAERLYVDFGAGRVALVPIDTGVRLKSHIDDQNAHNVSRFLDKTGDAEISGSLTVYGALQAESLVLPAADTLFTRGAVITAPTGPVSYVICALPKSAKVAAVRGYRSGGAGATINAQRNGLDLLPTDLSLSTDNTWLSGGSVQNTEASAGDSLTVSVRNVSGAPAYVSIQIDLQGA